MAAKYDALYDDVDDAAGSSGAGGASGPSTSLTAVLDATADRNDDTWEEPQPLIIPITSNASASNGDQSKELFIEIFPEEIAATGTEDSIPASTLMQVLQEESAPMSTWSDAALLFYQHYKPREGLRMLQEACSQEQSLSGDRGDKVRLLASMGIAHLSQIKGSLWISSSGVGAGNDDKNKKSVSSIKANDLAMGTTSKAADAGPSSEVQEWKTQAEDKFTAATRLDQLYPMTWVGKGMLNVLNHKLDQARYFFETTLKHIGPVLPALLGMAAVEYSEGKYSESLALYGNAIQLYPTQSGASVRVGFGMCCYRLGQVDRAKAAFSRAHALDPKNVEAMASVAILTLSALDVSDPEYLEKQEHAIKLLSMANLMDRNNAMVQNHLADHYFWKWDSVSGVKVSVKRGENFMESNVALNLDPGERVRIGPSFETVVAASADDDGDEVMGGGMTRIPLNDAWPMASADNLRLWKKDYDRVDDMAKAAYTSTGVPAIQAESLFHRARVMHVKGELQDAAKCYARSCSLAPDLTPSRWGWSQCQISLGQYEKAASNLKQVIQQSPQATEAHAALGLLQVHLSNTYDRKEALGNLKKATELDPLNVDLVLLQALVFQTNKQEYSQALERYGKAVEMLEAQQSQGMEDDGRQGNEHAVPAHVWTNIGVIHQELGKFGDALQMYQKAMAVLSVTHLTIESSGAQSDQAEKCVIKEEANALFYDYIDTGLKVAKPEDEAGTDVLKIISMNDRSVSKLKSGDHIKLSEDFKTEVKELVKEGESFLLHVTDKFVPPQTKKEPEDGDTETPHDTFDILVKRSTPLLGYPVAVTIAFNLARLHEDAGRSIAAVELLKAILQRHPSYVNCYLRLACIARDSGLLEDCSEWLKGAVKVAPQHAEVLTLVGNLHLSLCDWAPAQSLFDKLLAMKNSTVEAYSILSLGTIYFSNLNSTPGRYEKHLNYAADFYRRVLKLDKANFYAANGIGTILAEKADLLHAKDIFNRVREVSNDGIPDSLLNLGHIYLAQKRYPESLQMYNNYMSKTTRSGLGNYANKEEAEVLLYIAFAYFDWARQTELFNNVKAAPADERYAKCIQYIEQAMETQKENMTLKYNWCMAKLVGANCVLQKLARNIPRTALEVQSALHGLQEGLQTVQQLLKWKNENKKVPIGKAMLATFIAQCQANIQTAENHLKEELKKEEEAKEARELQRLEAEERKIARELKAQEEKEQKAKEEAMRERKVSIDFQSATLSLAVQHACSLTFMLSVCCARRGKKWTKCPT
jgi:RNA polymerase-associated protein CTR9